MESRSFSNSANQQISNFLLTKQIRKLAIFLLTKKILSATQQTLSRKHVVSAILSSKQILLLTSAA
jgi:hypothetical protein